MFDILMTVMNATQQISSTRTRDAHVFVTVLRCGDERGIVGLNIIDDSHASAGEHFIPFRVAGAKTEHGRDFVYTGIITAVDRLRKLKLNRVLLLVDDSTLVNELERKLDPPRELFLQYVILGCKLNEFQRAKVIVTPSERLAELRAKTANLAATIYRQRRDGVQGELLPLAPAI